MDIDEAVSVTYQLITSGTGTREYREYIKSKWTSRLPTRKDNLFKEVEMPLTSEFLDMVIHA